MKNALRYLYNKLSTLKVSVYLLIVLTLFYVLGTIFPQGGNIEAYINANGKFVEIVRAFNLLNIFNTPWFLASAFLIFLNLFICTYERFFRIQKRKKTLTEEFTPAFDIATQLNGVETEETLTKILKDKLGFKPLKRGEWTVFEKGLYYRYLTLAYHAGIFGCAIGLLISGLFVREAVIALPKNTLTAVTKPEILGWLGKEEMPDFKLMLSEFTTEYWESREIDYPKDKLSKLAIGLGWKNISYKENDESHLPKDWFSKLAVIKDNKTVYEKTIEVNDPLKFEGYTFYQLGYEQKLKIRINSETMEVLSGTKVDIPQLAASVKFGQLKVGKLYRSDGSQKEIHPSVTIKTEGSNTPKKLSLNEPISIGGKKIMLQGFEESSILSYRYDPGVSILWVAGSFVFIVMTLRCFGAWYMLAYKIESDHRGCRIIFSIKAKGLAADPLRIERKLKRSLVT